MESQKYSLNKEDLTAVGKGLAVALAGAALTYLSQVVTQTNFGQFTPLVVVLASVLVNVGRKFIAAK